MFKRVMVANRGEVAQRIIRTLKNMGIFVVSIYSDADSEASYLKEADLKIHIGPSLSKESYLNEDIIIKKAIESECEAIHPGFGFLSENARFAQMCNNINITFIGPSAYHISLMGDKNEARKTFKNLGFKVIDGSSDILKSPEDALKVALKLGYPVMLKAKAGGGGKGMRLIKNDFELKEKFHEAKKEAQNAFNDANLYMEKFIEAARHIEFQILGDNYNNVIHLGERECSVQRNNQKLIEEALANDFPSNLRFEIGNKLCKSLSQIGYSNAGTVEFLLDKNNELFFMEMNTRLQVEHPITELITGIDIVKEQIKIASNHKLSQKQEDIKYSGHAIEFRINAEDPKENFKPCPGKILKWKMPQSSFDGPVRIETHAHEGYTVSPFYDSMILKLIVFKENRKECLSPVISI